MRPRYVSAALLMAIIGAAWLLWPRAEADVCSHALAMIPPEHPVQPTMSECLQTLRIQANREWPWEHAAHRRCYIGAPNMADFHDCGGELAHIAE